MSVSKPSITEDSSESDESDYVDGDDDNLPELMKTSHAPGRKISISSTGNPMIDNR